MRLLMATNDWWPIEGGIATLSQETASALAGRGHHVTVLAPRVGGSDAPASAQATSVVRWPGYGLGPLRWLPHARALAARIGEHDAVLAMNPAHAGAACALLASLGRGRPFLVWTYGYELLKARRSPLAAVYRQVCARATRTVAISRYTRDLLLDLGVAERRIVVVPPGVRPPAAAVPSDPRTALGLPPGRIVLTVGRLVPRKGHRVLARAMARVQADHPDAVWVVVGRGPEQRRLAAEIARLGGTERMRLLGSVDDALRDALYREATLFALTPRDSATDAEGFGLVYLEAGAHGLPVVGSRCGGVPDAVEHEVTGFLVPPDDVAATAAAVASVLAEPDRARAMGAAGRARAERSSWDGVAATVEELLR